MIYAIISGICLYCIAEASSAYLMKVWEAKRKGVSINDIDIDDIYFSVGFGMILGLLFLFAFIGISLAGKIELKLKE